MTLPKSQVHVSEHDKHDQSGSANKGMNQVKGMCYWNTMIDCKRMNKRKNQRCIAVLYYRMRLDNYTDLKLNANQYLPIWGYKNLVSNHLFPT